MKNDLSSLNKTVINLSEGLVDHKQQTTSEATCTGIFPLDCCLVHESQICHVDKSHLSHCLLQIMIASYSLAETEFYGIRYPNFGNRSFSYAKIHVHCDMETDGGGWILIQRRTSNRTVNFTQNLEESFSGFGNLDSEFWIGLSNIYQLTNQQEVELYIFVWNDHPYLGSIKLSKSQVMYRLTVSGGTGDGNDRLAYHNGPLLMILITMSGGVIVHTTHKEDGGIKVVLMLT